MIVPLKKVQVRQDEDGVWIAKSSLLPGCHAHGRDRGEALLRFQQAAKAHLEALLETGRPIPPPFHDKFVLAAWFVRKYPSYNCRQLERRLRDIGCKHLWSTGSHRHYSNPFHPDRIITFSWHPGDVPRGIIADIIEDLGITRDNFYFGKFWIVSRENCVLDQIMNWKLSHKAVHDVATALCRRAVEWATRPERPDAARRLQHLCDRLDRF